MKIDPSSCERNIGIARSQVQTPFSGFFTQLHKLRSQLRGSVFISLTLFFHTLNGSISTKTLKHCYFLKSLKLEMKHCYVVMESSRTTIDNRRVCSRISSPPHRRGLILHITRRPEFNSYFSYPSGVNLGFLKTFWKVDVQPVGFA